MTNIEILYKILEDEIPEFKDSVNTFIRVDSSTEWENNIGITTISKAEVCRCIGDPDSEDNEIIVLRNATSSEIQLWKAYKKMRVALAMMELYNAK